MKFTKRQRREKKVQQKVRAKTRAVREHIKDVLLSHMKDPFATIDDVKKVLAAAMKEQLGDLEKLPYMEDVKFEMDESRQELKMSFRMKRVNGSVPVLPFFEDEYVNALKYDGGKEIKKELGL